MNKHLAVLHKVTCIFVLLVSIFYFSGLGILAQNNKEYTYRYDKTNKLSAETLEYTKQIAKEAKLSEKVVEEYYLGIISEPGVEKKVDDAKLRLDKKVIEKMIKENQFDKELTETIKKRDKQQVQTSAASVGVDTNTLYNYMRPGGILVSNDGVNSSIGAAFSGSGHAEIVTRLIDTRMTNCPLETWNTMPNGVKKTAAAWSGRTSFIRHDGTCWWKNFNGARFGVVYNYGAINWSAHYKAAANAETWLQNRPYPSLTNLALGWDNKWNTDTLYCSKLVWRAWIEAYGIGKYTDLDSNGGSIVWPSDIRNSIPFMSMLSW